MDESNVWDASRLVTAPATDAGTARIPTLIIKDPATKRVTREETDNEGKGRLFYETFFPPPNPAMTPIPQDYQYPPP
jgi:hypothetical protein